jgi:hypothetical protein
MTNETIRQLIQTISKYSLSISDTCSNALEADSDDGMIGTLSTVQQQIKVIGSLYDAALVLHTTRPACREQVRKHLGNFRFETPNG